MTSAATGTTAGDRFLPRQEEPWTAARQKETYAGRNENVKSISLPQGNTTSCCRNAKCLKNISNNNKFLLDYSIQYLNSLNENDFDSGAYWKNGHDAILIFSSSFTLNCTKVEKIFPKFENQHNNFGFMYKAGQPKGYRNCMTVPTFRIKVLHNIILSHTLIFFLHYLLLNL